jgi:hypothetical protein
VTNAGSESESEAEWIVREVWIAATGHDPGPDPSAAGAASVRANRYKGYPHDHNANNADTCRFTSEGLICEHWGVFDVAAMMRQLGVQP